MIMLALTLLVSVPPKPQDKPVPVPYVVIAKGDSSGYLDASTAIVALQKDWGEAWSKLRESGHGKPPPKVEFEKEVVVLITIGTKPSAGYGVSISRIEKDAESIRVFLRQSVPDREKKYAQLLTHPYVVARMEKPDRPVKFILEKD